MNDANMLIAGAVLGGLLVGLVSRQDERRRHVLYSAALLVVVLVYILFAAVAGTALVEEVGGGLLFAAMALAGMRGYPSALLVGWVGHAWWDAGMHGAFSPVAPPWYPPLCVGFDLVVAGAILHGLVATPPRSRSGA